MTFGATGFSLEINLSRGSIDKVAMEDETGARYLGGQGSAAKLIWDRVAPETDPLSPDNLLIFSTGLLVATPTPGANRTSISSISPQTNRYVNSGLGGFFGTELKHAGYDALVIRGKSPEPVYLWIHDNGVELRDAAHLLGKSALETTALIQEELKDTDVQVAAIGLAGENRVFQATIDHANCSASQGVGVIMGDKGLKAIAVRGTTDLHIARPEECFRAGLDQHQVIFANPRCGDILLREDDDCRLATDPQSPACCGRVQGYWTGEREEEWAITVESERISYQWENYSQELEEVRERVVDRSTPLRGTGCYNCLKGCHHASSIPGRTSYFLKNYARLVYSMAAHSELKLDFDVLAVMQEYGVDESAMTHLYAFVCELHKAGILTDEDLPEYPADAGKRLVYLVEKIARREGLGDALANGIRQAAQAIGRGAEAHWRGIQPMAQIQPPMEITSLPHVLMAATGDKMHVTQIEGSFPRAPIPDREERAAFVRGWEAAPERFKEWFLNWEPGRQLSAEAAVNAADWNEGMHYLDDALGLCPLLSSFRGQYGGRPPYHLHNMPRFISLSTGLDFDEEQLWAVSTRIRQLIRGINARRGEESSAEEQLPGMMDDSAEEQRLVQEYYRFRGWTPAGVPTAESLARSGLGFVSEELVQRGILTYP